VLLRSRADKATAKQNTMASERFRPTGGPDGATSFARGAPHVAERLFARARSRGGSVCRVLPLRHPVRPRRAPPQFVGESSAAGGLGAPAPRHPQTDPLVPVDLLGWDAAEANAARANGGE